ncbi:conserved exported hypothetical protein [Candidatus Sulfopaludibacter sp. SbA3]|nr:conserved exported hypothetical protein [Candidatus Sulfopaludibacter sp. SbA3]
MKIARFAFATLLAACFVCVSPAENRKATSVVIKDSDASAPTAPSGNSEVFQNIVIQAGTTYSIDSQMDYSSASTVAVGVQCSVCTTVDSSLGASGLILIPRWLVANTDIFTVAENKAATTFPYWDAGGAVFDVYGPQFRLTLQNTGSAAIKIQQVTIFRRGQ